MALPEWQLILKNKQNLQEHCEKKIVAALDKKI